METQQPFTLAIDTARVEREASPMLEHAEKLRKVVEPYRTIETVEQAIEAADWLNSILAKDREFEDWFKPSKKAANDAHKAICKQENDVRGPLSEAAALLRSSLDAYNREQKRLAAIKAAEDQAAQRKRDDDARQAEALALEKAGEHAEAAAVIARPAPYVPPPPTARPMVAGVTFRSNWKARIKDKLALIKHAAAHPEVSNLLEVNQTAADQMAKAQKNMMAIPGLEAYDAGGVAGSRR